MSDELKPCPFCGAMAERPTPAGYDSHGDAFEWYVTCSECGGQADLIYATEAEAVAAWNQRDDGWVSCAERLPDLLDWVLIHAIHPEHGATITVSWRDKSQEPDWVHLFAGEVTHWRPLPDPPEVT